MITRLGHIAMRTGDLPQSLRFYTDVLGLKEAFRLYGEDGALGAVYVYIAPYQFLELFANGERPAERGPDVIGVCHLCLEVPDIQEAYARVKERGGPLDSEVIVGRAKCLQFWTHDPDGNAVELMALPEESLQAQATRRLAPDAGMSIT